MQEYAKGFDQQETKAKGFLEADSLQRDVFNKVSHQKQHSKEQDGTDRRDIVEGWKPINKKKKCNQGICHM